ncbi:MAG: ABC-F family ATP-binding cassette domain-containing protein [Polyangiaceae bacterium]|nr:ABC-F family ATP-binding cassette domain-containing protein [Polyangiaceae bacterium]
MPVLSAHGLVKAYGPTTVLRGASLTIRSGERVGVVGRNGAGKSTLGRILAGVEPADAGSVSRRRDSAVLYLSQVPEFDGDPTVTAAVSSGLEAWSRAMARYESASAQVDRRDGVLDAAIEEQAQAADEVERLGGFEQSHRIASLLEHLRIARPDSPVSTLSGGEQRRVALARLLIAAPDLAILDEPTNHLDADTVEWLEGYLLDGFRGALLLITHDRYLLDRVATRTVEVSRGEVYSYDGGYGLYLQQKAERLELEARTEQNRQNFLRGELAWLARQPKARTTKQKARIDRAEAALAVERPEVERLARLTLDDVRAGKTILETRDLRVELGGRLLVDGLTLSLTQGQRIGIVGPNGAGKTTLLRTLLGQLDPTSGSVVLGKNTKLGYFDQLRSGLTDAESVFDNVAGDQSRIEVSGQPIEPRSYLERFGFDGAQQRQPVSSLSGGERARVALARLLREPANLLILDEPTNDLDTETLAALETMLCDMAATALVVTHDRWFLDRVATSILAFEGDARVVHYPGNYSDYRARARAASTESTRPRGTPRKREPTAVARKLSRPEERELGELPDAIDRAEARHAELAQKLSAPETYLGGVDVEALALELQRAREEADRLLARWEELELKTSS